MPSATARDFAGSPQRWDLSDAARQEANERWIHPDGRAVTIPLHAGREIGLPLFFKIIRQLGLTTTEFERLR